MFGNRDSAVTNDDLDDVETATNVGGDGNDDLANNEEGEFQEEGDLVCCVTTHGVR